MLQRFLFYGIISLFFYPFPSSKCPQFYHSNSRAILGVCQHEVRKASTGKQVVKTGMKIHVRAQSAAGGDWELTRNPLLLCGNSWYLEGSPGGTSGCKIASLLDSHVWSFCNILPVARGRFGAADPPSAPSALSWPAAARMFWSSRWSTS